jgi:hypothetical protein
VLHDRDMAGRAERDALYEAQQNLATSQEQLKVFERVYNGLSAYRPPTAPSIAHVDTEHPRSHALPLGQKLAQLRTNVEALESEVTRRDAAIRVCDRHVSTCGRAAIFAPNPWTASDGSPCFGRNTHEALEGAYCAYWSSDVNVNAADTPEEEQLLTPEGAPYCMSCGVEDPFCYGVDGTTPRPVVKRCSFTADRTIRSGMQELDEWVRADRPYCASSVFKRVVLGNASLGEEECYETLRERRSVCTNGACRTCVSPCHSPVARAIGSTLRCLDTGRHLGFVHYYHTSDAGQLARSMHGAVRKTGYKAVPEKLASHLYHIAHNNPHGHIQRDAISCRKATRNAASARFVAGFDEEGSPVARTGYHVACRTHADCMACGRHPLTGQFYRCQHRFVLYDTVLTSSRGELVFVNTTAGASDSFDIDLETGARDNRTGVCVDLDASMNEGCTDPTIASVKDGLVGCSDAFVSKFLCGLAIEVHRGDLSTVHTTGNLGWPRVLLHGADDRDGDGVADGELKCYDPVDCSQKCAYLERTSRHGAGAPPACALYAPLLRLNHFPLLLLLSCFSRVASREQVRPVLQQQRCGHSPWCALRSMGRHLDGHTPLGNMLRQSWSRWVRLPARTDFATGMA